MKNMETIKNGLSDIQARLARAQANAALAVPHVDLLLASKTQNTEMLEYLLASGHRVFGENQVAEAASKWPALRETYPDICLHLIGPLQTNKARAAVALFDVIQTLDRSNLADALADAMAKEGKRPACFIQVNTGEEPQKAGVAPRGLEALLRYAREQAGLDVRGLMCIPPFHEPPAPHFALLRKLAQAHGLSELSMGMSEDFETAIRLGATCVRVGRAVFGERERNSRLQAH